jgi:hypothetical protein
MDKWGSRPTWKLGNRYCLRAIDLAGRDRWDGSRRRKLINEIIAIAIERTVSSFCNGLSLIEQGMYW